MPYYVKIARHYEEARKHEEAERYYVAADMPKHAVNTYASAGKWDAAHRVDHRTTLTELSFSFGFFQFYNSGRVPGSRRVVARHDRGGGGE